LRESQPLFKVAGREQPDHKGDEKSGHVLILHVFQDRAPGHEDERHGDNEDGPAIQRFLQEGPVFNFIEHL
jgi:hypothetical protein